MEFFIEKEWLVEKKEVTNKKETCMEYSCDFNIISNKTVLDLAFKIINVDYKMIVYCEFYAVFNDVNLSQKQMLDIAYTEACLIIQERLSKDI